MRLEAKLAETTYYNQHYNLINKAVSILSHLDIIYTDANVIRKREIIGSIYPEKLNFDGFKYRTVPINEAPRLSYHINNESGPNKKPEMPPFFECFR